MSDAKKAMKAADRTGSRLLRSMFERLTAYMGRAGLIAFMADPVEGGAPPADTSLLGGGTPPAEGTPAATAAPVASPEPTAAPVASPQPTPGPTPAPTAAPKPEGAPEAYADFTLPEGLAADTPVMGEFAALAKEANLPQETAQKFVDLAGKMQTQTVEGVQAALEAQGEKWGEDAKADKEFGGDAFDANLAIAKTALDAFGSPELKNLLNQSKLGNHPEVLRAFVKIGKAISQDGFIPGRSGTPAKSFFDKSPELH